jgi:hypothetical protein
MMSKLKGNRQYKCVNWTKGKKNFDLDLVKFENIELKD